MRRLSEYLSEIAAQLQTSAAFSPDSTAHIEKDIPIIGPIKDELKTLVFISNVIASCQTREHLHIVNKWIMNMDIEIKYKIEFSNLILDKLCEC